MDKKKLTVYKHNDLIEARYSTLTQSEQILLLACISKCDPRNLTATTGVELSVNEYANIADIEQSDAYDDLKHASERLFERQLTIMNPDPDDPALTKTVTRWIHSINYYEGEGRIKLFFSPNVLPYLSNLKGNFTKYRLQHIAQFKSSYGSRLYELLIQWQTKGYREIEVDWLRKIWKLQDKYPRLTDLKRWVIEPSVNDINTYSNLWVKFGQRKAGRRIIAFQFQFGLKKPEQDPKKLTKKQAEALAKIGETHEELHARLKSEGYKLDIKKFS